MKRINVIGLFLFVLFALSSCGSLKSGRCNDCPEYTEQHPTELCGEETTSL